MTYLLTPILAHYNSIAPCPQKETAISYHFSLQHHNIYYKAQALGKSRKALYTGALPR